MNIEEEKLEIKETIEKIMKSKEYDLLNSIAFDLDILLKKIHFYPTVELINNLNLTFKERLLFYINLSKCEYITPTFEFELIPILMLRFINENKDNFLNLLKDEEVLNEFSVWFKEFNLIDEVNEDILAEIIKIPKISKEVLTDNKFYVRNNSFKIFNLMPKEYGPSIAFYSRYGLDTYEKELEKLYSKYFGDILSKKEQLELIKEQIKEVKRQDIFSLGIIKLMPFYHLLENTFSDKKYYIYLKNIQEKTNLDFNILLKFFYKYDTTVFFKNLCNKEVYSNDLIKKIEYLSYENRLLNPDTISDIDEISLNEIKKLPKEKSDSIILKIAGGPTGNSGTIFEDGYEREIRRIDKDGNVTILNARGISHEDAVKRIYSNLEFDKKCVMAIERAVCAAKELSSLTFIIENESCYVVSNNNLSEAQIEILNNLRIHDKDKSMFGIITFNTDTNNYTLAYNGETVSFDKLLEYMEALKNKYKKI